MAAKSHSEERKPPLNESQAELSMSKQASLGEALAARQVQRNLTLLEDWLEKWRIKININKCQAILFSKKTKNFRILPPPLQLHGQPIEWKEEVKYLGITLDKKLLFKRHIDTIKGKAYGKLKRLYPVLNPKSKLQYKTALTLYKTLLRPIITYACPVWGHAARCHIKKLQIFQNKMLYMITKLPRVTPVNVLHDQTRMETIEEFIKRLSENFYSKCQDHENPLVAELGDYNQQFDKHKRPKWILVNT